MRFARATTSLLLLAAFASTAHAEAPKTREEVKAELREAIRNGDMVAAGEGGQTLNEMFPQRYAKQRALFAAKATDAASAANTAAR